MTLSSQQGPEVTRFPLVGSHASEAEALVAIVRRLSVARSVAEVMDIATHAARTLLQADGITFVLREGDLCYYAEEDAIAPLWKGKRFPMSACISGWCMVEGRAAVIPDIYKDARIPQDAYRPTFVHSLVMVPVRQEAPIAAMGAYWAQNKEATPAQVELLQTVANAAALAIALVEVQQAREGHRRPWPLARSLSNWLTVHASRANSAPVKPSTRSAVLSGESLPAWPSLRPNSPAAYAFAVVCVAVATAARTGLSIWIADDLVPFATYFPAVLIVALVAGAAAGGVAIAASALWALWAFIPPHYSFAMPKPADAVALGVFLLSSGVIVWAAEQYRRGFGRLSALEADRRLVLGELQHRLRNTLAVVQSIVAQSLREQPEQRRKISSRISALVATSDLLSRSEFKSASLAGILQAEFAPYGSTRTTIKGEDVAIEAGLSQALALTFHELAVNSAKYGALSVAQGCVSVSWSVADGRLELEWRERDGPPVAPPGKSGFGSFFIERVIAGVGGRIDKTFEPQGFACRMSVPLREVGPSASQP